MTALVLDRPHFAAMTGGDRPLQLEIVDLFQGQAEAWRSACAGGEGWREAIHKLKGSARGIGLVALAQACAAAEQAPDAEQRAALLSVRSKLEDSLAELERFAADAA